MRNGCGRGVRGYAQVWNGSIHAATVTGHFASTTGGTAFTSCRPKHSTFHPIKSERLRLKGGRERQREREREQTKDNKGGKDVFLKDEVFTVSFHIVWLV